MSKLDRIAQGAKVEDELLRGSRLDEEGCKRVILSRPGPGGGFQYNHAPLPAQGRIHILPRLHPFSMLGGGGPLGEVGLQFPACRAARANREPEVGCQRS